MEGCRVEILGNEAEQNPTIGVDNWSPSDQRRGVSAMETQNSIFPPMAFNLTSLKVLTRLEAYAWLQGRYALGNPLNI
jgi:hypothetical protein